MRPLLGMTILAAALGLSVRADHSIMDYGAVAGASGHDLAAAQANGKALYDAAQAAHNSQSGDRTVIIPEASTFTYMPYKVFDGLYNVTIMLNGVLNFYEGNVTDWPHGGSWGDQTSDIEGDADEDVDALKMGVQYANGLEFTRCNYLTLSGNGNGRVHGNGLRWWWFYIFVDQIRRPDMLVTGSCLNTQMNHWHLFNSPRFHVFWGDAKNVLIEHCTIQVDITGQRRLLQEAGLWTSTDAMQKDAAAFKQSAILPPSSRHRSRNNEIKTLEAIMVQPDHSHAPHHGGDAGLPMFPINTDGFDMSGHNITVRHVHVENFDDALCAKPQNRGSNQSHCTTELHFSDSTITNGVGASVGSVPPNRNFNCIANTTFKRISFKHPIKAIYVKPNPCPNGASVDGTGIIDNILYEDIFAETPLMWSIYASTQQQDQPGHHTANTGCSFFYPIKGFKCPTQSCVPIHNLKLRNVFMENALLAPGILRCNEHGPCTGWEWNNVTVKSRQFWPVGSNNFLCQAVEGKNFTDVNVGCTYNVTSSSAAAGAELMDRVLGTQKRSPLRTRGGN